MKRLVLLALVILNSALVAFAFSSEDLNKVTFVNNLSGNRSINYLYFSPEESKYWGPDILDNQHSLAKGKKADFFVFYPEGSGKFNLMAVDSDQNVYEIKTVIVTDGKEKTVSISDKAKTSRTFEDIPMTEVVLTNNTDQTLQYVFLTPSDTVTWGIELLSTDRSFEPGDEITFEVPIADDAFDMDFLGIGENDDHYEKKVSINTEVETIDCSVTEDDLKSED